MATPTIDRTPLERAPQAREALERLIRVAQGKSGQSRVAADFLLAWWNAGELGPFNPVDLWGVDRQIAADIVMMVAFISRVHQYPDTLGYSEAFKQIIRIWRPEVKL